VLELDVEHDLGGIGFSDDEARSEDEDSSFSSITDFESDPDSPTDMWSIPVTTPHPDQDRECSNWGWLTASVTDSQLMTFDVSDPFDLEYAIDSLGNPVNSQGELAATALSTVDHF
jgi:hypothetical protein